MEFSGTEKTMNPYMLKAQPGHVSQLSPIFTLEGTEAQAIPGLVPKLVGSSHGVAMSLVHKAALPFLWQVSPTASVLLSSFLVHYKD